MLASGLRIPTPRDQRHHPCADESEQTSHHRQQIVAITPVILGLVFHPSKPSRRSTPHAGRGRGRTVASINRRTDHEALLEVPLRERSTRARFEIAFEAHGAICLIELDHDVEPPRSALCCVRTLARIMGVQASGDI